MKRWGTRGSGSLGLWWHGHLLLVATASQESARPGPWAQRLVDQCLQPLQRALDGLLPWTWIAATDGRSARPTSCEHHSSPKQDFQASLSACDSASCFNSSRSLQSCRVSILRFQTCTTSASRPLAVLVGARDLHRSTVSRHRNGYGQ